MNSDQNELIQISRMFLQDFGNFGINWYWLTRFKDLKWGFPPWTDRPYLAEDYGVIRCVKRALREARQPENKNRILVFDTLQRSRFVSTRQLERLPLAETRMAVRTFQRLMAFLNIYLLERMMSSSFVPFVDLADELDSIIEKFKQGADNRTLLPSLSTLSRKLGRQITRSLVSAILALVSLYLITPKGEAQTFVTNAFVWGFVALVFIFVISSSTTWANFPELLEAE